MKKFGWSIVPLSLVTTLVACGEESKETVADEINSKETAETEGEVSEGYSEEEVENAFAGEKVEVVEAGEMTRLEAERGEVGKSEVGHVDPDKEDQAAPAQVEKETAATPQYEQFVSDYNSFISKYFDSESLLNVEEFQPGSDYHQQMSTYVTHSIKVSERGKVTEVTILGKIDNSDEGSRELPAALAGSMFALDRDIFESIEDIDDFLVNKSEFATYVNEDGWETIKAETDLVEYLLIDRDDGMIITMKRK
ncbi:hypothetical protein [Bacillus sp. FJAT-44742]|uniref:hypothetical protein n=1 Tax=Bacillus sp. FJAT-44742 TaxID=2014005 RepID=UPI000C23ED74|nr:hypothetical protein [Bacillus sp. FJAT-44742]